MRVLHGLIFKSKENNEDKYFLPVIYDAIRKEEIDIKWEALKTGISERYNIVTDFNAEVLLKDSNDKKLVDLFKIHTGKILKLQISGWKFINFEPNIDISFEKNLKKACDSIKEISFPFDSTEIARIIEQFDIPVQIINERDHPEEILFINVVR